MHNARQAEKLLQRAVQNAKIVCIINSISEGTLDTTSTCDNLLHLQIGHPRTSTLPHGQCIWQTGGQSFGQISEWIEYDITCVHGYKL